jgi:hypothetical protein
VSREEKKERKRRKGEAKQIKGSCATAEALSQAKTARAKEGGARASIQQHVTS